MTQINIVKLCEIKKLIKDSEEKLRKEFYQSLNRINEKLTDIQDIQQVLNRGKRRL